ncbi:GNAT family N-acetyltransferase [Rhodobacter sp. KR11]|uniref:GNAT family N-acetyltransferase n=1 Tax=Rhodobacter sp. KR11 TaxID=2974588 RepID=UPI002221C5F0|nr:GNAT family N-acetyltransferase [Rhodobacter sp. KR11]MCW1918395.1 GNAT family N-acetyltransferase [Rhodobacter sp. KR11]
MSYRATLEATWLPAETRALGCFTLRRGAGGGKRVSAASLECDWTGQDLAPVQQAMRAWDQPALFVLWPGQQAFDAELSRRGYRLIDPVVGYAAAVSAFDAPPRMTTFPHWPPMEIARELWAEAGTDAARLQVMERAAGPKSVILARSDDKPAGIAFVALHGPHAMIHAVEVRPQARRRGVGRHLMQAAAGFAAENGAETLSLAVTEGNSAARALYSSLGMRVVEHYHYRIQEP